MKRVEAPDNSQEITVEEQKECKPKNPAEKKKRKRTLTPRQAKFVTLFLEGKSNIDAVMGAGYNASSRDSASHMANEILTNPVIKSALVNEIKKGQYDQYFTSHWEKVLKDNGDESEKIQDRALMYSVKNKTLEQIARIGGLHAPTRSEHISADLTSIIPQFHKAK